MSEHHEDELTAALHRLRAAVRERVPVPASAAVRAAATRQLRVRRTAIGALAAAAVAAIALGGAAVLQPSAAPDPVPPAESPEPPAPAPPSPSPSPVAEPDPVPPAGFRPPPPEPFTAVEWRHATIDVPPQEGCPSGAVTFVAVSDIAAHARGPAQGYPQILLNADGAGYGDLTGDGRPEAVVKATCAERDEDSLDGEGQLLVVSRDPGGDLRGLAWVGPRGAIYHDTWIVDETLYTEAHPWHGEGFAWAPGGALRYQWDGTGFGGLPPAEEYPPILPSEEAGAGPPVALGPVAAGLGCPDGTVRFGQDGTAVLDGVGYDVTQPSLPSSGPHLIDLDQTGQHLLVLAIGCGSTRGLGVFERGAGGFEGVSVLIPPAPAQLISWNPDPGRAAEQIAVQLEIGDGGPVRDVRYRWTGSEFAPVE